MSENSSVVPLLLCLSLLVQRASSRSVQELQAGVGTNIYPGDVGKDS